MNPETVQYIYEGYLANMSITSNENSITLRNLFDRMRTIITYHDMSLQSTVDRIAELRAQVDAIEAHQCVIPDIPIVRTQARTYTSNTGFDFSSDEISLSGKNSPVPESNYYEEEDEVTLPCDTILSGEPMDESVSPRSHSGYKFTYCNHMFTVSDVSAFNDALIKITLDSQYKVERIANHMHATNSAALNYLVARRRQIDARLKNTLDYELCSAMYNCIQCGAQLSDSELDAKACNMYYSGNMTYYGCSCMCYTCMEQQGEFNDDYECHSEHSYDSNM